MALTNYNPREWPDVDVIVVTKGRHDLAQKAVQSICETDYPPDKRRVIVVEETDMPAPITGPGVEYHTIPEKNRGVAFARNRALSFVTSPVVAFTDNDCIVEKNWLKEIVRPLDVNQGVAATAGAVRVTDCGIVGKCENILGFPGGGAKYMHRAGGTLIPLTTFSTCNAAVHRDLAGNLLHFREGFQFAGEDELLSRQISADHTLLYTPFAVVYHAPRDSIAGVFSWLIRRGQAQVEMIQFTSKKSPRILRCAATSPLLRLSAAVLFLILAGIPVFPALGLLACVWYTAVAWRYRWSLQHFRSPAVLAALPFVKFIMDVGMDVGIAKGLLVRFFSFRRNRCI